MIEPSHSQTPQVHRPAENDLTQLRSIRRTYEVPERIPRPPLLPNLASIPRKLQSGPNKAGQGHQKTHLCLLIYVHSNQFEQRLLKIHVRAPDCHVYVPLHHEQGDRNDLNEIANADAIPEFPASMLKENTKVPASLRLAFPLRTPVGVSFAMRFT